VGLDEGALQPARATAAIKTAATGTNQLLIDLFRFFSPLNKFHFIIFSILPPSLCHDTAGI
jgi:hypothetical protein